MLLTTFIWGCSYPIGRLALDQLSPWAYGAFRFMFGTLSLLPLALPKRRVPAPLAYSGNDSPLLWLKAGSISGLCLSIGAIIQLTGMTHLPASEVGFMTTLYVSMVPVLAFIIGYIPRLLVVAGLLVGLFGLYLLTGGEGGGFGKNQMLIMVANVFWALQVIITGHYAMRVNTWMFSLAQAAVASAIALTMAFLGGQLPSWGLFFQTLPYSMWGILSVGVAYTCQALAQKELSSTSAALFFPLQSVIGAILGVVFLGEAMNTQILIGAGVIISGCVIAQFARESIRLTPDHNWWQPMKIARYSLGILLVLGTAGGFVWAIS